MVWSSCKLCKFVTFLVWEDFSPCKDFLFWGELVHSFPGFLRFGRGNNCVWEVFHALKKGKDGQGMCSTANFLPNQCTIFLRKCEKFVLSEKKQGGPGTGTGTVGTVFAGTERGTGTAGTVFQEPKPEPEPSSLLHCTETHKNPLLRGTVGTENRNRSNRSTPEP